MLMLVIRKKLMCVIGVSIILAFGGVCDDGDVFAEVSSSTNNQAAVILSAAQHCPTDLSSLQPRMEKALQSIQSSTFKDTMRASLHASIPEALEQADGLARQIAFLQPPARQVRSHRAVRLVGNR